ncbi:SagB/ThcOx family dehydrogenase [Aliinostoc sp. HNIBRCY26]|uniref:SagB/ThcOx family dehydrogenase n=1 Tax=Aliinostoc sp. HNIBRCY26 TaxID=3418997 RepID=UPI003D08C581
MYKVNEPLELTLLYHLNSPPPEAYAQPVPAGEMRYLADTPVLELPPVPRDNPLASLLSKRLSVRAFQNVQMSQTVLAQLLDSACGINGLRQVQGYTYEGRNAPSAGGLYPLEMFVSIQEVTGLAAGLYHYEPRGHTLQWVNESTPHDFITPLLDQDFITHANALFILTGVFMRSLYKYGTRGYRFVLFEAGHQAENICLMAVELGLGSLCLGGFHDSSINRLLGIDGQRHATLYCIAVGSEKV